MAVSATESINLTKAIFKQGKVGGTANARWTVTGVATAGVGQTVTAVYGKAALMKSGGGCDGTAANPECIIGISPLDSAGNYTVDYVTTPDGRLDPPDTTFWSTKPTTVVVSSSLFNPPVTNSSGISVK
jgi:hypothetical protein